MLHIIFQQGGYKFLFVDPKGYYIKVQFSCIGKEISIFLKLI